MLHSDLKVCFWLPLHTPQADMHFGWQSAVYRCWATLVNGNWLSVYPRVGPYENTNEIIWNWNAVCTGGGARLAVCSVEGMIQNTTTTVCRFTFYALGTLCKCSIARTFSGCLWRLISWLRSWLQDNWLWLFYEILWTVSQKWMEGSCRAPFQETMPEFVWKEKVKQMKPSFGLSMLIDFEYPHSRKGSSNYIQHHYYHHHRVIFYNHSRSNSSAFRNFSLGCHCHNTKHVRVPLGTAIISAYCKDAGLMGYLAGWQVWSF